ncbi:MAG: hypothetical protein HXK84_07155, partial [Lachnospiraceae bacterium]|nr:hypothetical protein [Lachnospiraceae bacterium]
AESFYASEGNPELLNRCMAGAGRPPSAKQGWIYYYDEKGRLSSQKEALFCVTLVVRRRGEFLIGEIKVQKNRPDQAHRKILEKLVIRKYLP